MKSLKLTSLLCGGVLSLTATNALAQQSSSTQPGSSQPPSSSQPSQSSQSLQHSQGSQGQSSSSLGHSSSALGASSSMQSDNSVRLSDLMRANVQSQEGKTLGNIRDITIDPQSGRVEFAILSLSSAGAATDTSTSGRETVPSSRSSTTGTPSTSAGATAGKLIPVPWQLFSQSMGRSRLGSSSSTTSSAMGSQNLVLNVDESKLQTAPSFDASNWNQMQSGALAQRVYSHFGVDQSSAAGTPGSSIRGQGTSGSSTYPSSSQQHQSTQPQSGQQGSQPRSQGSQPQPQGGQSSQGSQPQGSSPDR